MPGYKFGSIIVFILPFFRFTRFIQEFTLCDLGIDDYFKIFATQEMYEDKSKNTFKEQNNDMIQKTL